MRAAALRLMEWYHSNYWLPQSEYLREMSSLCLSSDVRISSSESTVLIPKEHQTQYDMDPDLPIFLEDSPSFNSLIKLSGSTFITEIFIPLFLCSVYSHDLPHGTISMKVTVKSKKLRKTFELWWGRALKIQESSSKFYSIICTRLFVGVMDALEKGLETTPKCPGVLSRLDIGWRLAVCESWVGKLFKQNVKQLIEAVNGKNSELERDAHIHEEIKNRYRTESASRGGGISGALRLRYNEMLCVIRSAGGKKSGAALQWMEGLENVLCTVEMILDADLLRSCVALLSEEYNRNSLGSAEEEEGEREGEEGGEEDEEGDKGVDGESDFDGSIDSGDDNDEDSDGNDDDRGDSTGVMKDGRVVANEAESSSTVGRVISNSNITMDSEDEDHAPDDVVKNTSSSSGSSGGVGRGVLKRGRDDDLISHSKVQGHSTPVCQSSSSSSVSHINAKNTPTDVNNNNDNSTSSSSSSKTDSHNTTSSTENSNKKANKSNSHQTNANKNTHKQTPKGWTVCSDHSAWPLGLLQGEGLDGLGRCPLYLLAEVKGR